MPKMIRKVFCILNLFEIINEQCVNYTIAGNGHALLIKMVVIISFNKKIRKKKYHNKNHNTPSK